MQDGNRAKQSKAEQSRTEQIKPTGLDIKQHKAKRNRHRKTGGAADLLAVLLSKPCPSGCSCWLTRLLLANQRFWRSEAALLQSRRVSPAVGEKAEARGKRMRMRGEEPREQGSAESCGLAFVRDARGKIKKQQGRAGA